MRILYCQTLHLPKLSAHAIHTGTTAANLGDAGADVLFFPGLPFSGRAAVVDEFFSSLGFTNPRGLEVRGIPFEHKGLYGLFFRLALLRAMREEGRCLAFASSVKEAAMALQLRRFAGRALPVVFEAHHLISRLKTGREAQKLFALEERVFREAEMIVFTTDELRKKAEGYLPKPRSLAVVPLGFNQRVIGPVRANEEEDSPLVRLAYLGSLQAGKGVENLLNALLLLPECYSLTIIGGKPEDRLHALRKTAESQGLGSRVTFVGQVLPNEVREKLAGCDIFVIPMETDEDFFGPMKMYEAIGFALPIVATPVASLQEQLSHGENALIAGGKGPEHLASAIIRLGTDPRLRKHMRESNARRATSLSSASRARVLLGIFRTLGVL